MTCRDCKFFFNQDNTCHRYPPVYVLLYDAELLWSWPELTPDSWCGEIKEWPEMQVKRIEKAMEEEQ